MREIKFRAWDEKNEVMVTDFYVNGEFAHKSVNGQLGCAFRFDKDGPFFCPKLFVMQYTGLKDKNGAEIYEGDIVRAASAGEWRELEVRWRQEGAPMFILYPAYGDGKFWNLHG